MSQSAGSLTSQQLATLQSAFLVIRTTRPLLELLSSQLNPLNAVDRMQLQMAMRLLLFNEARLAEQFSEELRLVLDWVQ